MNSVDEWRLPGAIKGEQALEERPEILSGRVDIATPVPAAKADATLGERPG